jgi:hypothetical protein
MTEIHNSRIENIKISEGVYVVDAERFLELCEERSKDGVPSVLSEGCKIRKELYEKAINDTNDNR